MISFAEEKGITGQALQRETDAFVDFFTSANAREPAKKDWGQTWRNWISKARPSSTRSNGRGNQPGQRNPSINVFAKIIGEN